MGRRELSDASPPLFIDAWRRIRSGGPGLIGLVLGLQVVIIVVCLPLIRWLFREALRASGMTGLDLGALTAGPGLTVTVALIVVICIIAFWLVSAQYTVLVIALELSRSGAGLSTKVLGRELWRIARKLWRPSSLPLQLYLFVVLPLTGFGFTSVLTRGISVPPFISGELIKSPGSTAALLVFFAVLMILNIRFCLAVPLFALTHLRGGQSLRTSWRLTRGLKPTRLIGAILTTLVGATIATLGLIIFALVPTALTDELAPAASHIVAAYSFGIAQVAGFGLSVLVTTLIVALLLAFLDRARVEVPTERWASITPSVQAAPSLRPRRTIAIITGGAIAAAAVLGTAGLTVFDRLQQHPDTLVLAHRGFSEGGVENTLSGLDAAAEAGADLVEMDVMQTADGEFVAMHDASLSRLTGRPDMVKDLTLDEITALTVTDQYGHSDLIPSFSDYVQHAAELELPLLIEIKLGGADLPGFVEDLVAELESLDALDTNIYHSLDAPSVERLKQLRPDLTVGYTMAFAGIAAPDTPADFIVVEEWTASDTLHRSAQDAGLAFMVWTVNTEPAIKTFMRQGVDGIITDHPDTALSARSSMQDETGLADALIDLIDRFVVVI